MSIRHYASPEDVQEAFYEALQQGDLDALMALWSDDEEIVCVHPTGVRLLGHALVRESFRSIFSNTRLRIQAQTVNHWQSVLLATHHLTEVLFLGKETNPHGPLHVTHVFARGAHGWRFIARHASAAGEGQALQPEAEQRILH